MAPTLLDGDYVLARLAGRGRPAGPGDIVVIQRPGEARMVKRLGNPAPDGSFPIAGDGIASAPAVDLGRITRQQIVARAVIRLSGNRLGLLRPRRTARP